MELNEKLESIDRFKTYLPQFTSGRRLNIPQEEKDLMKTIYRELFGVNVHFGCPPCIENAIYKMMDWAEKNRPT